MLFPLDAIDPRALDAHITGNYGEDCFEDCFADLEPCLACDGSGYNEDETVCRVCDGYGEA